MFHITSFRKASLVSASAAVAFGVFLAPSLAGAQPAPPPPPGAYDAQGQARADYDACERAKSDRGVAGAVIGGVLGGLIGSGVSGYGHRTGGTLIGAGVGAVGGAAVGSSGADCNNPPPPPAPPPEAYQDRGYDGPPASRYYQGDHQAPPPPDGVYPGPGYEGPPPNGDYYGDGEPGPAPRDGVYAGPGDEHSQYYDNRGYRVGGDDADDDRYDDRGGPSAQDNGDCTLAKSPIYMPDGSVQQRFVHVCRDENGRYQVVQ